MLRFTGHPWQTEIKHNSDAKQRALGVAFSHYSSTMQFFRKLTCTVSILLYCSYDTTTNEISLAVTIKASVTHAYNPTISHEGMYTQEMHT